MGMLDEIYRRAFADALTDNLQGDRLDELTPTESEQAVSYAKEFADGEVEAARRLLADTSRCPLGVRCESCGTEGTALAVTTAETEAGVLCLTQCARCAEASMPPPVAVTTAARLAAQHCAHVSMEVPQ